MGGIKTLLAKQALVRYIREGNLKAGTQLPSQEELRQRFGFGTATIAAALHELHNDKVIEVRDKIGAFVLNPATDGHAGRIIGLASNALAVSVFRSCLSNLLQIRLADRGWQMLSFFCMEPVLNGQLEHSAFAGLHRTVEQKGIEALITLGDLSPESLNYFAAKKLPVVFVGSLETNTARVIIDMTAFLNAGLDKLADAGIRRPAILISEALREQLKRDKELHERKEQELKEQLEKLERLNEDLKQQPVTVQEAPSLSDEEIEKIRQDAEQKARNQFLAEAQKEADRADRAEKEKSKLFS